MVKAYCNNVLWEVYIGVSGQGDASIGPSLLLRINKSPINIICFYLFIYLFIIVDPLGPVCRGWGLHGSDLLQ